MNGIFWKSEAADAAGGVHALVIGISAYDHLAGGIGEPFQHPLASGLEQLGAAASSAVRVASWLRDHLEYPKIAKSSIRLLISPGSAEAPLVADESTPPATFENVKRALVEWRRDCRRHPDNVAFLFIAGHGLQTTNEGGIVLLQDFGAPDSLSPLERAIDVVSVRRGMMGDPNVPESSTPAVQYFFYDACRVRPTALEGYDDLNAGLFLDEPKGAAARASWVYFGSRPRDYALADTEARTTLFSKALLDCLDHRAQADTDGRTILFSRLGEALEQAIGELADTYGEEQEATSGGAGSLAAPVHRRPAPDVEKSPQVGASIRSVVVSTGRELALSIKDPDGHLVADGFSNEPLELAPGRYEVEINLPWGSKKAKSFAVEAGSEPLIVEFPDAELEGRTRGSTSPRLARQLGYQLLEEPAWRDVVSSPSTWYLRFLSWQKNELRPVEGSSHLVEVDDFDEEVAMIVHPYGGIQYAQLRTEAGASLVVALPAASVGGVNSTCWLFVRVVQSLLSEPQLRAVVRPKGSTTDAVAGYLTIGRADQAAAVAHSAEDLLQSKVQDPLGAALGGYALLRLNDLDRLHDWPDNLSRLFTWLPDGAVIAGELAARQDDSEKAAELIVEAGRRGIPVFSEGLSLLSSRSANLAKDPDLKEKTRKELKSLVELLSRYAASAEFGALASTMTIDPAWDGFTASQGWRRFVPTSMPEDPRSFWADP